MTCNLVEYQPCAEPSVLVESFLSRLSHVYIDGENMRAFLTALLTPYIEIENVACTLFDGIDCETATGLELDLVGQLIGLPRTVCNAVANVFFGFQKPGDPDCCNYPVGGFCDSTFFCPDQANARYRDYTFTDDEDYRFFLKAVNYANAFDGTLQQYEHLLHYLFDGVDIDDEATVGTSYVLVHGGGRVRIAVQRDLTDDEKLRAELFKHVLPYYGSTDVKIVYGDDFFRMGDAANGLCMNFGKVI